MKTYYAKTIAVFLMAFLCNACDSKTMTEMFLSKGKVSGYDYSIFKLSDTLILHPPAQYGQFWDKPEKYPALPKDVSAFPVVETSFQFHMPNFTGHTAESIKLDFDKTRVDVIQISAASMDALKPGAPGAYPPNMFSRNIEEPFRSFDPEKYEEKYGLRCYERSESKKSEPQTCYGKRDSKMEEYVLIRATVPPYDDWITYPIFSAYYFSPKYGGIEIAYRTHMDNFPKWREIDAQVWKFLDAWNVAPKPSQKSP